MRVEPRPRRRGADRWGAVAAGVMTAVLLGFLLLPVVAIFSRVPPGTLLAQLHSTVVLQALGVSLRTSLAALVLVVAFGTPAAYLLAQMSTSRWSVILTTLLELPLVLPPAVAGIGLLAAFGRVGLLGGTLRAFGIEIPFTQAAVVMALTFVAMPFYVRQAVASFATLDRQLLASSRTLGAGAVRTFARVALPLAAPGLSAGAALAWARALGEFGATIMFAGSFPGVTQTLSLAIYAQFQEAYPVALAMAALLVVVSAGLLVTVKLLLRGRGLDSPRTAGEPAPAPLPS
jgi:molybdate transport system permease protein